MGIKEISDLHSASDEYAARFSGASGAWMLSVQDRALRGALSGVAPGSVLDVGGGHGQLTRLLISLGFQVKVLGSSNEALLQVARRGDPVTQSVGDLLSIPESDKSFDVVTSFRLVTHCENWQLLIKEFCRVAKSRVIIDYPVSKSLNALTPILFGAKKGIEKNTRSYRLFSNSELDAEFAKWGFQSSKKLPQFFWPMVIHRVVKNPGISEALEFLPKVLGLTGLFGSPIVGAYERIR